MHYFKDTYHVNEFFKSFQYVNMNETPFTLIMTPKLSQNSIICVYMIIFHLLVLGKLWSLLCNLSRNAEIDGIGLCWFSKLGLSHGTAGPHFWTRGAVRVLRVQITSGALQKLKEVLLDGALAAGQPVLHLHSCSSKQTRQMLSQLLPDLSVETAVEEGVGREAEVADPGHHLLHRR